MANFRGLMATYSFILGLVELVIRVRVAEEVFNSLVVYVRTCLLVFYFIHTFEIQIKMQKPYIHFLFCPAI